MNLLPKDWLPCACFGIWLFSQAASTAVGQRELTPQDILNVRWTTETRISPDGIFVAYVMHEPPDLSRPSEPRPRCLWLAPATGKASPHREGLGHYDVHQLTWSPDSRSVAFLSNSRQDNGTSQIWLLRVNDSARPICLTHVPHGVNKYRWSRSGHAIAFSSPSKSPSAEDGPSEVDRSPINSALSIALVSWHADNAQADVQEVTDGKMHIGAFDWSPDEQRFVVAVSPSSELDVAFEHTTLQIINIDGHTRQSELATNVADADDLAWSPDGSTIAYYAFSPRHFARRLALLDVETGEATYPLRNYRGTPITPFRGLIWSADSQRLFLQTFEATTCRLLCLDVGSERWHERADQVHNFWDYSISVDERTVAVNGEDGRTPPNAVVLAQDSEPVWITQSNPQLRGFDLGKVRQIKWHNKTDNQLVYGVLVTPDESQFRAPHPTVVALHGGPQGMWWNSWLGTHLSWGQQLASRGYAVFLPNPRGSIGQGWEFSESVYQQWGKMDYRDVMDGVDYLVAEGIADPDRLGIGGWSYGGYLTAAATTQTDRFKAAIVGAGITDLRSYPLTVDFVGWVRRFLGGHEIRDRHLFLAHSPLENIENCNAPTLVLHGEKDARCPLSQGRLWYRGLKSLQIETEMVVYPGAGHVFSDFDHRRDVMARVAAWYDKHLMNAQK